MEKERLNRIEKAIEWIAFNLTTYGGGDISRTLLEILYPPNPKQFMECDTCRAKSGSPTLCKGCLHNRTLIDKLTR